jgi:hypothetical protein
MEQPPIDVAKLVHDYMRSFAKCYKVPRHYDEEDELLKWCESIGKQYRDCCRHQQWSELSQVCKTLFAYVVVYSCFIVGNQSLSASVGEYSEKPA